MTLTPEQIAKSNDKFEAMMAVKYPFLDIAKNSEGVYIGLEVWHMNRGWMLRQESLVFELPERNHNEYRPEFSLGWNSCLNKLIKSLQSAGINYREKE